jgi:hypothetical protein
MAEPTTATSAPQDLASAKDPQLPGTRTMSPYVASTTPGFLARLTIASTSAWSVTHTGHPGPESKRTSLGSIVLIPDRKIDTVWVPHTSITVIGRHNHLLSTSKRDDIFVLRSPT